MVLREVDIQRIGYDKKKNCNQFVNTETLCSKKSFIPRESAEIFSLGLSKLISFILVAKDLVSTSKS